MQHGKFNFQNAMNFQPTRQPIVRLSSQNPPIHSSFGFNSRFHQSQNPNLLSPPPRYGHGGYSDYEQKLRDEVIYLHSLWHRGPPNTHTHTQTQTQTQIQIQNPVLKPLPTTSFKNKKKKKRNKNKNKTQNFSDKEWPVDPKSSCPSPPTQGWDRFKPQSSPKNLPSSAQDQERVLSIRVHLKGLDSCIGFFKDDEDEDEDGYDEEEAFELFLKVFEEDESLRAYYKAKCESGEFYCLVCGIVGNKLGRKYKNCVALVQHSVSISKTKRRIAHEAYGRAICKVFGWDIDRLPSINSQKFSQSTQGEIKDNVDFEDNLRTVRREGNPADMSSNQAESKDVPNANEMASSRGYLPPATSRSVNSWGEFKPPSSPKTFPVTAQERDRALSVRLHLKGLDSCIRFFDGNDDDHDDEVEEDKYDEEEAFELLFKVFEEDESLRSYYKARCENGEFYCLVCGIVRNKLGRKFKDCVALIRHTVSISKTKKKIAHRAYGRVVCKLLGWDIDRLPSLPSMAVDAIKVA